MSDKPAQAPAADPAVATDWDDAACVVNAASEIQDAAHALSRDPLSPARAEEIQALLTDPGVAHARTALARLVDGQHPSSEYRDGRW